MRSDEAFSAIRALRMGIVPSCAIEDISVGYAALQSKLANCIETFGSGHRQEPLFVNGDWGTGKTHTLALARRMLGSAALLSALVSLNARSVPLNYPQRIYGEIAASVRVGGLVGLRPVLHSLLVDRQIRNKVRDFVAGDPTGALVWPLSLLVDRYERDEVLDPQLEFAWSRLLGEDLGWSDYGYKREQALVRVEALGNCFKALTGAGLVLFFDEVETIEQLANYKSRLVAYAVISRFARCPSLWSVFAITERFKRVVDWDVSRNSPEAEWLLSRSRAGKLEIFETPSLNGQRARALGKAIAELYERAHRLHVPDGELSRWIEEWGRNPGRNPRRLIRLIIARIDLMRPLDGGGHVVSSAAGA